jgi:hypothetical protein
MLKSAFRFRRIGKQLYMIVLSQFRIAMSLLRYIASEMRTEPGSLEIALERVPFRSNRKAALLLCFIAFSRREPNPARWKMVYAAFPLRQAHRTMEARSSVRACLREAEAQAR